jgi:hypothetical protein
MGLERFLQLARDDLEDEWDSDELDSDDDFMGIQEEQPQPRRRGREWMGGRGA